MIRTGDLYVIYQHDEHYTSYILDDLLFHSQHDAERYCEKVDKSTWKAPVKIATLAQFIGDMVEAMQDEGFDLAYDRYATKTE